MTRLCLVGCLCWLAGATSGLRVPCGTPAVALHAAQRAPAVAMMAKKGRAQGGGPKTVNNGRKKKSEAQQGQEFKARNAARAASKRKPPTTLFPKRQSERHHRFIKDGGEAVAVCARAPGGEWLDVGHVSFDEFAGTDAMAAAQLQKRLIFEHALCLHAELSPHRDALECGVRLPTEAAEAAAEAASEASAAEEAAAEEEEPVYPAVLLDGVDATPLPGVGGAGGAVCGFLGLPDPAKAGHYFANSEQGALADAESKKVTLEKLGVDSKSAVQTAFQKTLGLRSG